ncbi:MAG TPA: hypothetical protein VNT58_00945 [Gaiellaceae bacterium]|nr:hypothetical protein [Gaiellaceae bacterium]
MAEIPPFTRSSQRRELEEDIRILRVMIDTALDRRHLRAAEACAEVLRERRARLDAIELRRPDPHGCPAPEETA